MSTTYTCTIKKSYNNTSLFFLGDLSGCVLRGVVVWCVGSRIREGQVWGFVCMYYVCTISVEGGGSTGRGQGGLPSCHNTLLASCKGGVTVILILIYY